MICDKRESGRGYQYLLIIIVFMGYLVFGFSENVKGPAIPRIQAVFSLNEMQIGLLLAFNSLAYLLACSFTGLMSKKLGIRFSTMLALGIMAVSGVLIFYSVNYTFLSASYFIMYLGNGMLEIALGILAARIFVKNTGMMMNLSHFFYGLSSTAAPVIATALMETGISGRKLDWNGMYLIMLSLSLIPFIQIIFAKLPENKVHESERMPMKEFAHDSAIWMLVVILTFGVVAEVAAGGWLVNFLEKVYNWDMASASRLLSAFFLTFTLSRLLLGALTDRIGFVKSLIIFSGASGVCSVTAVLSGEAGAFLFAAAGAGIAPIYPTVMALLAKRYPKDCDTAISFTVTFMGIGNVAGSFMVGAAIDIFKKIFSGLYGKDAGIIAGMQAGYLFIGLCALLCSAFSIILYRHLGKHKEIL